MSGVLALALAPALAPALALALAPAPALALALAPALALALGSPGGALGSPGGPWPWALALAWPSGLVLVGSGEEMRRNF